VEQVRLSGRGGCRDITAPLFNHDPTFPPPTLHCSSGLQIPPEELDIQDQIGGGGFALVHRGMWRGTPVAIKTWFDPQLSEAQQQEFRCGGGWCSA
jgi:hypothetical protein